MGAALTPTRMTAEECLAWESTKQERHECIGGEFSSMTGARLNHNRFVTNALVFFRQTLSGHPCEVIGSDMKLHIDAANVYLYPDLMVTCDPRDTADGTALSNRHPWLIVEVLPDNTAAFDCGGKFEHYRRVESLTHYLLVEQTRPHAELFRNSTQGEWVLQPLEAADTLHFDRPRAFDGPMATLFDSVPFAPGGPDIVEH
jgi:Uma2 family endonuclease